MFFDITEQYSFANLKQWLYEIEKFSGENVRVVMVGNKCDLEKKRTVSKEEAIEFANKNKLHYIETSAKNNINIQETVEYLCGEVLCLSYPELPNYLHYPNEWSVENHSKFPIQFKRSVFCFLFCLKKMESKFKLKVPKVIRFEIIKRSFPRYNIAEILNNLKKIELPPNPPPRVIQSTKSENSYCRIC